MSAVLCRTSVLLFLLLLWSGGAFSQCTPVASYPFTGNANDASGHGNNGIPGGAGSTPLLTADRFGHPNSAYLFGGLSNANWIRIPNSTSLRFTDQFSISFWFRQCSFSGMDESGSPSANGSFVPFSKAGDGIYGDPGLWCFFTSNTGSKRIDLTFGNANDYSFNDLNFREEAAITCIDPCEWVHCVFVVNQNLFQCYINGRLVKEKGINTPDFAKANMQDLYIGRMGGGGTAWFPFSGVIDDIDIYDCALTPETVADLHGNYNDPLAGNNEIRIDSVKVVQPNCLSSLGSVSIFPDVANGPYEYSRDAGSSYQPENTFSYLPLGAYTIRIKSGCTFKDTTFNIDKPTYTTSASVSLCEGRAYFTGGRMQTTAGVYYDTIRSRTSCDTLRIITLSITPRPRATITQTICSGQSYYGHTRPGLYSDTFATSVCDSIRTLNLYVLPYPYSSQAVTICEGESFLGHTRSGAYVDTVKTAGGCDSIVRLSLTVIQNCDPYFPTAFTPNGDGTNDVFKVLNAHGLENFRLEIYSRWGQKIFESKDPNTGWSGYVNGLLQPTGVYIWRSTFLLKGRLREVKGTIALIK